MSSRTPLNLLGGALWNLAKALFAIVVFIIKNFALCGVLAIMACLFLGIPVLDQGTLGLALVAFLVFGAAGQMARHPEVSNPSYTQNRYDDF